MLPSYAFCRSDESGFVDASDFHAMAINFEIETEIAREKQFSLEEMEHQINLVDTRNHETDAAYDAYIDELAARNEIVKMQERGISA